MKILDFPEFKQIDNYDCGANVLLSVLTYFGIEAFESEILKLAETGKQGTSIKGMLKVLEEKELKPKLLRLSAGEIKKYINKKIPVILRIQAWTENKNNNWKKDWGDGHYVVAIGYDSDNFYFEDPWCSERTYLKFDELKDRWHDIDIDGKKYTNYGIVVSSKKTTYDSKKLIHMD